MTDIDESARLLEKFILAEKAFTESLKEARRVLNKAARLLNKADTARERVLRAVRR